MGGGSAAEEPSLEALVARFKGSMGADALHAITNSAPDCTAVPDLDDLDVLTHIQGILRETLGGDVPAEGGIQVNEFDRSAGSMEVDAHETGEAAHTVAHSFVEVADWDGAAPIETYAPVECREAVPTAPMTPAGHTQGRRNPRAPTLKPSKSSKSRYAKRATRAAPTAAKARLRLDGARGAAPIAARLGGFDSWADNLPFITQDDIINTFPLEVLLLKRKDFNDVDELHQIRENLSEYECELLTATRRRLAGNERARRRRAEEKEEKLRAAMADELEDSSSEAEQGQLC